MNVVKIFGYLRPVSGMRKTHLIGEAGALITATCRWGNVILRAPAATRMKSLSDCLAGISNSQFVVLYRFKNCASARKSMRDA